MLLIAKKRPYLDLFLELPRGFQFLNKKQKKPRPKLDPPCLDSSAKNPKKETQGLAWRRLGGHAFIKENGITFEVQHYL